MTISKNERRMRDVWVRRKILTVVLLGNLEGKRTLAT